MARSDKVELRTNARTMRHELVSPSGSASDQPADGKGVAQLLARSDQHEIDRIAGQSVAGNGEARQAFALQDLQAEANDARQDEIRGEFRK